MKVEVGDQIPEWVMERVQIERMRTMAAILRDPNPVHWDVTSELPARFGGRTINQGPLGLSYMINMLHEWTGPTSVRHINVRFPKAVLMDDFITARGQVTAVREEGGETLVDLDMWLEREPGDKPLVGEATVVLPG